MTLTQHDHLLAMGNGALTTDLAHHDDASSGAAVAAGLDAIRQACLERTAHGPLLAFPSAALSQHAVPSAEGTVPSVRLSGIAPDALVHALRHGTPVQLRPARDLPARNGAGPSELTAHELPASPDSDDFLFSETAHQVAAPIAAAPSDLERALTDLDRAARRTLDETASHALYLALGFLEWAPDHAQDGAGRVAPILLVPVTLHRGAPDEHTGTFTFTLHGTGDDAQLNIALRDQLVGATHIELPEPIAQERPDAYFSRARQAIAGHPAWTVHRHAVVTVLRLDQQLMYRDFDPQRWPEGEWPVGSALDAFLGAPLPDQARHTPEYTLDSADVDRVSGPLAFDADSVQHSVVLDACANRTVVMHAGPGTGATQTLANTIAALLAVEQSVLVVSNTVTALDATRRTLEGAGLGVLTFNAYGSHATLPAVLADLSSRITRRRQFRPVDLSEPLRELNITRDRLAEYATLLNAPSDSAGHTMHDVLWAVDRYRRQLGSAADALRGVTLQGAELFTDADRTQRYACLDAICAQLGAVQDTSSLGASHPWAGVDNPSLTHVDERALTATLETVVTRAIELASALNRLTRSAGWAVTPSIPSIDNLLGALDSLPALSSDVVPELLSHMHDPDMRAQVSQWYASHTAPVAPEPDTSVAAPAAAAHDRDALPRMSAADDLDEDDDGIRLGAAMREEEDALPLPEGLREEEDVLPMARHVAPEPDNILGLSVTSPHTASDDPRWAELAQRCRPARVPRGAEISSTQRAIMRLRDRAPRALTLSDAIETADERNALATRLAECDSAARALLDHMPRTFPITPATITLLGRALTAIEAAPLADLAYRHNGLKDPNAATNLLVASQDSSVLRAMRDRLELRLTLENPPTVSELRRYIAALGSAGALSFLDSSIANARKAHKALLRNDEKASIDEALRDCQLLATYIDREHRFNAQPVVTQAAGEFANGINTPFDAMSRLARWYADMCELLPEHDVLASELLDCIWTAPLEWLTAWRTTTSDQVDQMAALNSANELLEHAQAAVFGLIVSSDQPITEVISALRSDAEMLRGDIDTIDSLGFDDTTDWALIEDILREAAHLESTAPAPRLESASASPAENPSALTHAPTDDVLNEASLDAFEEAFDDAFVSNDVVDLIEHHYTSVGEATYTPSAATEPPFPTSPLFDELGITVEQCAATLAAYDALANAGLPDELQRWLMAEDIAARYQMLAQVKVHLGAQREAYRQAVVAFERGARLDSRVWFGRDEATFLTLPLTDVVRRSERAIAVPQRLTEWLDYLRARQSVTALGLTELVRHAETGTLPANKLRDAFEYLIQQAVAQAALAKHPALAMFDGAAHLALQRRYAVLDREVQRLRRKQIAFLADQHSVPLGVSDQHDGELTELGLLEQLGEIAQLCRSVPDLLARAGRAVQALKPCFFMSPQAVGRYLTPGSVTFDYVILDDAARMTMDEAASALARGRHAIVVGDPMRLSVPNNVLQAATRAYGVHRTLRRHHRSLHPAAIAYANTAFYNESLVVLPAPSHIDAAHGDTEPSVMLDWVADATVEHGRNPVEAERVADVVFAQFRQRPTQSLGVIAVTDAQRDAIADAVDRRLKADAFARHFFDAQTTQPEPFFIKAAHEAQGETRDVIVASMTVAPSPEETTDDLFAPLSDDDGYRLLTVLSTSARRATRVVSSVRADDVLVRGTSARGVCALKDFLTYAESNGGALLHAAGRAPLTDFEVAVSQALRARGFDTVANVQVSGEPIDLAVRDPRNPDQFVLGIRGDGANYHRPADTRSRDRLQADALARLGWPIAQLWSVQWLADPNGQADKLADGLVAMLNRNGESATTVV